MVRVYNDLGARRQDFCMRGVRRVFTLRCKTTLKLLYCCGLSRNSIFLIKTNVTKLVFVFELRLNHGSIQYHTSLTTLRNTFAVLMKRT